MDEKVALVGSVSETPWQHLIAFPATHPVATYFDVGKHQIVIYSAEEITAKGELRVRGTVLEVSEE